MLRPTILAQVLAFLVAVPVLVAQDAPRAKKEFKMPRESPAAVVRQELGLASVEIAYARPAVLGRDLTADLKALNGGAW